jgi:2-methylcitrate dehydratase PrpD
MAANGIPRGVEWQDMETARTPRIRELAERISYTGHPEFREKQRVRVEIAARGSVYKEERDFNSLHDMTEEELVNKYRHNASRILTEQQVEESIKYFLHLENLPKVSLLATQIT